jgi:hypothetical protein
VRRRWSRDTSIEQLPSELRERAVRMVAEVRPDYRRTGLIGCRCRWPGTALTLFWRPLLTRPRTATRPRAVRYVSLGSCRDVTIIEAAVEVVICADAQDSITRCYAARTGWDPRREDAQHVYLIATPRTTRAWSNLPEMTGRTIMRGGQWTAA